MNPLSSKKFSPHNHDFLSGTDLLTHFKNFLETLDCMTYACNTNLPYLDSTVDLLTNSEIFIANEFYLFFSPKSLILLNA